MIQADKKTWFRRLFFRYQKHYLFPRYLHGLYVSGDMEGAREGTDGSGAAVPVLYVCNHVSWWDGLVLFQLTEQLSRQDHYIMMDEQGLRNYPFFRKIGAFSVNRSRPRDMLESLGYAESLLQAGAPVWVFPQGAIMSPDADIRAASGIGHLMRRAGQAELRPVTLRYLLGDHQKPLAAVRFGEPIRRDWGGMDRSEAASEVEALLRKQAAEQRSILAECPLPGTGNGYEAVWEGGRRTTAERYRKLKEGIGPWQPFSRH
ncbi:lysophospholipid acyltransferase family protein [Paenibacillus sp. D51F]